MNEKATFVLADQAIRDIVDKIRDEQWDMELPADFPTLSDDTLTLRQIIEYQAYDEAWIPSMMAGRMSTEVGEGAFGQPFDNDLLAGNPKQQFAELVQKSIDAVEALDEADLDSRTVHYSYGDYPAREALWHAIVFRATRAYDVAKAIGANRNLPQDLVQATWDIVEPNATEWREIGVFGPEVDVPESSPLQDRLLGLTGREP
jgi:uncharacterized protein (TIGR03086 family)